RQQRAVAPDAGRARLDVGPLDVTEVVSRLQRPETLDTREAGAERVTGAALAAGQSRGRTKVKRHEARPSLIFACGHPDRRPELAPCPGRPRHVASHKPGGLPGLRRAGPSTPLDEQCSIVATARDST